MLGHEAIGAHALGGGANAPVTAGSGVLNFTLTLNAVGLKATRHLDAEPLSFALALNAVTLRTGFAVQAEPLHFFLTLNAVDFLTTQPYLPRASVGLNFYLYVREGVRVKARSSDTIYDGSSTGTTLASTDIGSILRLVCAARGKWFVLNKTGLWTLS